MLSGVGGYFSASTWPPEVGGGACDYAYTFLMGNTARFLHKRHSVLETVPGEAHDRHEPI